jgi:hypothetical protein
MSFNYGEPITNSERWNSCDTLFADFSSLQYLNKSTWVNYGDLSCAEDNASGWYFDKISSTENEVSDSTGITC